MQINGGYRKSVSVEAGIDRLETTFNHKIEGFRLGKNVALDNYLNLYYYTQIILRDLLGATT